MTETCPICGLPGMRPTVQRNRLPAMQNYVHRRLALAREAGSGGFDLRVCSGCGFAHNAAFDPALLHYDEGYDNSVPSPVMAAHYTDLAAYLHDRYALDGGLVVDVGCGKGTFLKIMADAFPNVRGLGIDPSYEGESHHADGRLEFIKDFFSQQHVRERPALVVCRHVVEHIPRPGQFLDAIHAALDAFPATPCFFEVPDTSWIIDNAAFWDFCYEHCNYLTPASFANALARSGFLPKTVRTLFGAQYIGIETTTTRRPESQATQPDPAAADFAGRLVRYADSERAYMSDIRQRLLDLKQQGRAVVLWGMATKGVVFSLLVDADKTIIDHCVDVNANKQGCFVPLTGHTIESPDVLARRGSQPMTVIVMNPNYAEEIKRSCRAMSVEAEFTDAGGKQL